MEKKKYICTIATVLVAAVLWYTMFMIKPMNFWLEMSLSILCLGALGLILKRDLLSLGKITKRHILIGILSAIGLYAVFYAGNIISGFLFPFKDAQISMVYGNKAQGSLPLIGLLLFFIIGPGEELYWRGFIQSSFARKFGENKGYAIATLLYAGVHISTGNFMLVLAALVCGVYWGWIYKKEKSLIPVLISHAIWDLTIFVLLPVK
jgi:membrane protease YdiL (CAAX protease family)